MKIISFYLYFARNRPPELFFQITIMYIQKIICFFLFISIVHSAYSQNQDTLTAHQYYFSGKGNDHNNGTRRHPLKTLDKLNSLSFQAGDRIYFHGGEVFKGNIFIDSSKSGSLHSAIIIGSYGIGKATINAGNETALSLHKTRFIVIKNLMLKGAGRKTGNTKDGLKIDSCSDISVNDIDISGFQKSGLLIYASSNITNRHVYAHENGSAGISVEGPYAKKESNHKIYFGYCRAENNPGDPTNLTNHSGNGIVVANCTAVMIEYCTATNNGWDMPRMGNGPVGIWAYEADSVTIQHCLSFKNKTSKGGADGGGFDLDGGVTNSIVQYNFSYQNQGAGYCIFQYLYATPWYNNIFRFNISENDGLVSDAKAGIHIWNSSRDSNQFYNCLFYNNTIYNEKNAAISYSELSDRKNFYFYNNIFEAGDSLIKGTKGDGDIYGGNDWWSINGNFKIEKRSKKIVGLSIDPGFQKRVSTKHTSAKDLIGITKYQLPQNSLLRKSGIDLKKKYVIDTGKKDFLSKPISEKGIGACL